MQQKGKNEYIFVLIRASLEVRLMTVTAIDTLVFAV